MNNPVEKRRGSIGKSFPVAKVHHIAQIKVKEDWIIEHAVCHSVVKKSRVPFRLQ